jgi:hypothetical protein
MGNFHTSTAVSKKVLLVQPGTTGRREKTPSTPHINFNLVLRVAQSIIACPVQNSFLYLSHADESCQNFIIVIPLFPQF